MNKYLKYLLYFLYAIFVGIITAYFGTIQKDPTALGPSISGEITNSGIISTGSGEPTTILDNKKEHKLEILTGAITSNSLNISNYPQIKINSAISGGTILFEIEPADLFQNYGYFSSDSYYFAFRFFIGDFQNGGYYNVFRKTNNGVGNDISSGLNGAISGKNLSDGYVWSIPLDTNIAIAKDKDSYGYGYINTLNMINANVGKRIHIGGFLSSIKEVNGGWEITKIKSIKIIYEGNKGAITLQ